MSVSHGTGRANRSSSGVVNVALTTQPDPWRLLALSYAPGRRRAGLEALFALDAALGQVLRTTREPLVGQMRLAWWREALAALDTAPPPGEPVLQQLAAHVLPAGVTGASLAGLADGWEVLLGELSDDALDRYAQGRGGWLFERAALVLGADDVTTSAGEGWALADLAANLSDVALADRARDLAHARLDAASKAHWSRPGRALGALAIIARRGLDGPLPAWFVFRLARFRLTGR